MTPHFDDDGDDDEDEGGWLTRSTFSMHSQPVLSESTTTAPSGFDVSPLISFTVAPSG
jgi:hypothetical protein